MLALGLIIITLLLTRFFIKWAVWAQELKELHKLTMNRSYVAYILKFTLAVILFYIIGSFLGLCPTLPDIFPTWYPVDYN